MNLRNLEMRDAKGERGASLIVAMLALLILSLLTAGLVYVTKTETFTSANYTALAQARYAAEAGVQSTVHWFENSYTAPASWSSYNTSVMPVTCASGCSNNGNPIVLSGLSGVSSNYPDSTVASSYNSALNNQSLSGLSGASFSTYATLISSGGGSGVAWLGGSGTGEQIWQITSQGTMTGVRTATVQVVATYEQAAGAAVFPYAVFATGTACPTINFSSSGYTDSYDSSQGTYAATVESTGGNVGTNGALTLSGSADIKGDASFVNVVTSGSCPARTYTNGSSKGVEGSLIAMGTPKTFTTPVYPNPSPALTTSSNYSSNISLSPGNYPNVSVSGGKTLTLSPGTYNFNSLTLSGGSVLTISGTGTLIIEIAGAGSPSKALDFSGGSIANGSGVPANVQIVYAGSLPMVLSGGSNTAAVVYAPNSAITMSGSSPWFGAIVSKSYDSSGGSAIHYDRNLATSLVNGGGAFQLTGFSWSKF